MVNIAGGTCRLRLLFRTVWITLLKGCIPLGLTGDHYTYHRSLSLLKLHEVGDGGGGLGGEVPRDRQNLYVHGCYLYIIPPVMIHSPCNSFDYLDTLHQDLMLIL